MRLWIKIKEINTYIFKYFNLLLINLLTFKKHFKENSK